MTKTCTTETCTTMAGCSTPHANKDCLCYVTGDYDNILIERLSWSIDALLADINVAPTERVFVGPAAVALKKAIAAAEILIDVHLGGKTYDEEQAENN